MADQKELNIYMKGKILEAFGNYAPEYGEKEISHTEAVEALKYAISYLDKLPVKF